MLDVSFEINGRKVCPNQVVSSLERAILESVKKEILQKVGQIRNPKTGERPRIRVNGRSLDKLSFKVSGSDDLIKRVKQKLG